MNGLEGWERSEILVEMIVCQTLNAVWKCHARASFNESAVDSENYIPAD